MKLVMRFYAVNRVFGRANLLMSRERLLRSIFERKPNTMRLTRRFALPKNNTCFTQRKPYKKT